MSQSHNVVQGHSTTPDIVDELLTSFIRSKQAAQADPEWEDWKRALLFHENVKFSPLRSNTGVPPPISRLPNEIFMEVVLTLYDQDGRPRKPGRPRRTEFWRSLMLVCKAWRATIGTAAAIWRNIEIAGSERWFFLSLARAKGTTLNITLYHTETFCSLAPTLCRLRPLIRELALKGILPSASTTPALAELVGYSMDALEGLDITFRGFDEPPPIRLDPTLFPLLRTVYLLEAKIIVANFPFTSRLCDLDLEFCHFDRPLDLVLFLKGLSACESLKRLNICTPGWNQDWARASGDDVTATQGAVTLPSSLRLFQITAEPWVLQHWILRYVHFHPQVKANLEAYQQFNGFNDPPFTLRSIFPNGPGRILVPPLAILHTAQTVQLTVPVSPDIGDYVELLADPSSNLPRTKFALHADPPVDGFAEGFDIPFSLSTFAEETASMFHKAPVKSFELRGNFRSVARETLLNILRAFPDLTHLGLDAWDVGRCPYEPSRNESQWGVIGLLEAITYLEWSWPAKTQADGSGSTAEPLGAKLDSLTLVVYSLDVRIAALLATYVRIRKEHGRPLKHLDLRFAHQVTAPLATEGSNADHVPALRKFVHPEGTLVIEVTGPRWVETLEDESDNWTLAPPICF